MSGGFGGIWDLCLSLCLWARKRDFLCIGRKRTRDLIGAGVNFDQRTEVQTFTYKLRFYTSNHYAVSIFTYAKTAATIVVACSCHGADADRMGETADGYG